MNTWLAEMFGTATPAAPAAPAGQEKTAQLELFAKLAADEGIDLTTLSPQQVDALYRETFGKQAEEGESEEGESEEKEKVEEAAAAEHEEKKAQVAKLAEAELMGQVMAHSFVRELNDIEKSAGRFGDAVGAVRGAASRAGGAVRGAERSASESVGRRLSRGRLPAGVGIGGVGSATSEGKELIGKAHRSLGRKVIGGAAGVGAVGTGGGIVAAKSRKKEASAFELLAAQNAIKVAAAAGYDEDQALKLVESVYNLGLEESEKVAYVEDTSNAIHVRSLEYLEKAGYPVNWEEVFGS